MSLVVIDTRKIRDERDFHKVFAELLGFPDFYGANWDAWIDCMSYLGYPEERMSTVHAPPGGVVVLHLEHMADFAERCPKLYENLIECSAIVNLRCIEMGESAVLALAFRK